MTATQALSAKASTTLSSASSEIDGDSLRPAAADATGRSSAASPPWSAVAFVAMPWGCRTAAPQARQPAAAPAGGPVAPPPPVAPPARQDRHAPLRGRAVGRAPLRQEGRQGPGRDPRRAPAPQGDRPSDYFFRLAGYKEVSLTAKPNADRTLHVVAGKGRRPARADRAAATRTSTTRRPTTAATARRPGPRRRRRPRHPVVLSRAGLLVGPPKRGRFGRGTGRAARRWRRVSRSRKRSGASETRLRLSR